MKKNRKSLLVLMMAAIMTTTAACGGAATAPKSQEQTTAAPVETAAADIDQLAQSPDWVANLEQAQTADQLFVVAGVGETTAYVSMHEKDDDNNWHEILTTPGYIGKYGLGKTKEGDAKTPVGTYHFTRAFGIADDPGCAVPYYKVTEDDYWSGDQREGYHYNEMVSIKDFPDLNTEDSEHLIEYTDPYQYCINISYNEEGEAGKGSAIFLHCLGSAKPYTGGCVAIPEEEMVTALQNVDEDCVVVIDTLEKIAPDYYDDWDLGPKTESEESADPTESADSTRSADLTKSEAPTESADLIIEYGNSQLYTMEDMDAAMDVIQDEFSTWKGCEMHSIRYSSDDCNSEENLKWVNGLKEGKNYTQCIQFLTDFHSPVEEEDLKETAWEPDTEYKDYQWTLARAQGGDWELVTMGY